MLNWIKNITKRWQTYDDVCLSEPRTLAGVSVTEVSSLGITSVWCAVSTISSLIGGLPLELYKHVKGGKEEATEHPLYNLLRYDPNPEVGKEAFWQTVVAHVLLHGNSYSEIERDGAGRAVALWLLPPYAVHPKRDEDGKLLYEVRTQNGSTVQLAPENCFHLSGLADDGLIGFSPIRLARESLGLTISLERFGAAFFGNSARPAGVLQTPNRMDKQAKENLRESWQRLHAGPSNVGRTVILEEGLEWKSLGIPPEDAQYVATRGYQIMEVARLFNISPVYLHDLGRATWANLETLNRQLVQITLQPWLQKIESQVRKKLIAKEEQQVYFAEHDVSSLVRADTITQYQAYASAVQAGWMLRSEIREEERLAPIEGLDEPTLASTIVEINDEPQPQQVTPNGNQDQQQQSTNGQTE